VWQKCRVGVDLPPRQRSRPSKNPLGSSPVLKDWHARRKRSPKETANGGFSAMCLLGVAMEGVRAEARASAALREAKEAGARRSDEEEGSDGARSVPLGAGLKTAADDLSGAESKVRSAGLEEGDWGEARGGTGADAPRHPALEDWRPLEAPGTRELRCDRLQGER
jgi:hypothetical protein